MDKTFGIFSMYGLSECYIIISGTTIFFNRFADGQGNNPNHGFLFANDAIEDCAVLRRKAGGLWYYYHCVPLTA